MHGAAFQLPYIAMAPNMQLKPVAYAPSDVPLRPSFANGFAILSQTQSSVSRRLTGCYAPRRSLGRPQNVSINGSSSNSDSGYLVESEERFLGDIC